jgi:uncharacterized membrane protein YuzA (DUF378 family)
MAKATYRQEATTRISYLSVVTAISLIVGLVTAAVITSFFPHSSGHVRDRIFFYSAAGIFGIICAILVYKVDQKLNKRFSQNPKA